MLAETYLAAGARKVYLPIFGLEGVDAAGLKALDFDQVPGRKIECTSQHPLGTCRMGIDPKTSVVNPDGETWDVRELYIADECFMTGTAANVTPVVEVDHRPVGEGKVGPITRKLLDLYGDVVRGKNRKYMEWCTPAYRVKKGA